MNNEHRIVCVGHCCGEYHDMDLEDYKKKVLAVQREKIRGWLINTKDLPYIPYSLRNRLKKEFDEAFPK